MDRWFQFNQKEGVAAFGVEGRGLGGLIAGSVVPGTLGPRAGEGQPPPPFPGPPYVSLSAPPT